MKNRVLEEAKGMGNQCSNKGAASKNTVLCRERSFIVRMLVRVHGGILADALQITMGRWRTSLLLLLHNLS